MKWQKIIAIFSRAWSNLLKTHNHERQYFHKFAKVFRIKWPLKIFLMCLRSAQVCSESLLEHFIFKIFHNSNGVRDRFRLSNNESLGVVLLLLSDSVPVQLVCCCCPAMGFLPIQGLGPYNFAVWSWLRCSLLFWDWHGSHFGMMCQIVRSAVSYFP